MMRDVCLFHERKKGDEEKPSALSQVDLQQQIKPVQLMGVNGGHYVSEQLSVRHSLKA